MASSSADCVFGVARLISSARRMCPKMGPRWNWKCFRASGVLHDDVGADDVARHQVGRELDAGEGELEALREGLDQECLAEPGDAFQQHVTAREEADQHLADDVVVADDDLADLGPQRLVSAHELLDSLLLGLARNGRLRHLNGSFPALELIHHRGAFQPRQLPAPSFTTSSRAMPEFHST